MGIRHASLVIALVLCAAAIAGANETRPVTSPATQPVRILFDTDMLTDCDDAGAMAVLHALADAGEAEILATVVSVPNPWSAACVDAINHWYGRPDLPIGVVKGKGVQAASKYVKQVAAACPHDLRADGPIPDAVDVYRRVLEAQPDQSVVVLTVGYMTNLRNLLLAPAEGDRPSGKDLAARKVKLWVCMGGNFIGRPAKDDLKLGNVNFQRDAESALYAIQHWPTPVVFVGREVASVPSGVEVGANLRNTPKENPVRVAYRAYFGGTEKDRHVADPASVLFAVRGLRDYWDVETKGYMDLKPDMKFEWRDDRDAEQSYLLKKRDKDGKPNDAYIERTLDELMTRPPKHGRPRE